MLLLLLLLLSVHARYELHLDCHCLVRTELPKTNANIKNVIKELQVGAVGGLIYQWFKSIQSKPLNSNFIELMKSKLVLWERPA